MKCDKIIELNYLKRSNQRAGMTVILRESNNAHCFLLEYKNLE